MFCTAQFCFVEKLWIELPDFYKLSVIYETCAASVIISFKINAGAYNKLLMLTI